MNKGVVSTGSKHATQAAVDILESGGNAIDAAVSAVFTSMTSEYPLTGISGGGAMMIKLYGEVPILYDFFVDTPKLNIHSEIDFIKTRVDFGSCSQYFYIGKGSVAIPGNLAGLVKVQKEMGQLPLSIILEPSIELAKAGLKLNKEQASIYKILEPIYCHTLESRKLFYKKDKILEEGDMFINQDFSSFLARVSEEGSDFFYKGDMAKVVHNNLQSGGLIDYDSMKNYQVMKRKPVCTKFHGLKIYSNPAPSAGGSLIIFLLRLLESSAEKSFSLSMLIKAMSITNIARHDICIDPNDVNAYLKLLKNETFKKYYQIYLKNHLNIEDDDPPLNRGCTTHVSIIDKKGNCVSVTTSNGEGSGYIIPNTGVMLNNMLGEEDLNPNGFHNWIENRRLSTMMSPSIVTQGDKPIMIIGSGGSNRIRSAIVQVMINFIIREMTLKDSIEAPRVHLEGKKLYYEPGIDISKIRLPNQTTLHPFNEKNLFFGGVNAVTLTEGFSDTRRGGDTQVL